MSNHHQSTYLKLICYLFLGPLAVAWLTLMPTTIYAQDKSGVKPQVISLPTGPGSLEGLGESFEPNLSTGTASYPVKFTAAPGRVNFQPEISLDYNGGNANGPWGMGWKLSIPSIQRRTEDGLPTYDDTQDTFIYSNGEKLVPLTNGDYRFENEGAFMRFRRLPNGGWEAHTPNGIRYIFGESDNARVANHHGIFRWELERMIDTHGNELRYHYLHDGDYAYPREIRYNFGADEARHYNAVIFNYEPRPDTYTDRRSGAPIRMGLRGTDIQMWALGKLVRAYQFTYEPERSTGKYSLLTNIVQVGDDGTSMLPPHTFTYTQFDASQHEVVTMQNPPPVTLTNRDVELVDINADGLPDIVYTPEDGQHRFYLNRGQGRWQSEPVLPQNSPAERLSNPNVRMADVNGDGRVDLLVKAGITTDTPFYYYSNHGGAAWSAGERVDFGPSPAFDLNDPNVQLLDFNNDRRIDVGLTVGGRLKIWLARETGWSREADFDVPAPAAGDAARFDDPKIKVVDMSGDGMQDLVMVRDGRVILWEHNGNGSYEEGQPLLNPPTGVGSNEIAIQMDDLNNDGQGDLVMVGNRTVTYWLSLGDGGLSDPIVLQNTPAYNAADTAVRLADIDGDGASELLFSSASGMSYVDFSVGGQPFLLASIDNGRGRTIAIDYKSSIEDYIADWDADRPWEIKLPFPVQVVRQMSVHDANSGDTYTIDYHYRDGFYDGEQKEFRGFVRSQEIKRGDHTAETTVTNLVYDVGMSDESRKGMLLESEVLSEGGHCSGDYAGCYQRTVNQLATRIVVSQTQNGQPIAYAFIRQTDSFIHEQQAEPVQLRQTFNYDQYGNETQVFKYGQVCGDDVTCGDDELLQTTEYIYDLERWLLNRPQRVYQTDAAGKFVSETRFYYDGEPFVGLPLGQLTRGDLVREERNLGPKGNNRFIPTKRLQIDQYGNQIGLMDGNGNRITVEYDPLVYTFPVVEQRHFADGHTLTFAASYHYGFGQPISATDYNGHPHIFTYDTFGRLEKLVKPGDTLEKPTESYHYEVGSPRSSITTYKRMRSGEDAVLTSVTYSDGLGRTLQTRTDAGNGQVVVSDAVRFNARMGVAAKYLPYFSTGYEYAPPDPTLPHSRLHYDALGRVIRTTDAEGAFVRVIHKPLAEILYDEEDNYMIEPAPHLDTPQVITYDGLERIVQVEERNLVNNVLERYITTYQYDRLGNLTQITDAQGNVKTMEYDALSRRLRMVDPNRGETIYTYDDNGNLIKSRDAKGQEVIYTYDAANRPLTERWVFGDGRDDIVNAIYHYDADRSPLHPTALNTLGQIAYIEDQAGAVYFSYDARGNMIGSIRNYKGDNRNFVNRRAYDAMDRLVRTAYADGSQVTYEYDNRGLLSRIPGYVEAITYNAAGQRESITYANGAQTTYTYDTRQRLQALKSLAGATVLQDFRYTLDQVGNVQQIIDGRPHKTASNDQSQHFVYDSLYRLLHATGSYGEIDFGYDPLGNLVHKTSNTPSNGQNLGELRYGENGAGPYALTFANGTTYDYDANGNLIRKGTTTYQWNPRDQLVAVADSAAHSSYQYDTSGKRVIQQVIQGPRITVTLYPDGASEVRGDQLILYVFDDEKRIAEIIKPLDNSKLLHGFDDEAPGLPTQTKRWYLSDHLGSTHLILDEAAQVVAEKSYYPFGESRHAPNPAVSPYDYTGKELDASGLYYYEARYYDPEIGRFISVDPLYVDKPQEGIKNPQLLNLYAYTLNNPLKYVDPDGANPQQQLTIPLRNGFQHPRTALIFEMKVETWRYNDLEHYAKAGMNIRATMTVATERGGKWIPQSTEPVSLRFRALPNAEKFAVAGSQAKVAWTPQTVKTMGMCVGNLCLLTHRASGGQSLNTQTYGITGFYDLILPNGNALSLDGLNAEGCTTGMPYFVNAADSIEKSPTRHGVSAGVGVNLKGGNVEDASHIISGPTTGSYQQGGYTLQKAQKPPH